MVEIDEQTKKEELGPSPAEEPQRAGEPQEEESKAEAVVAAQAAEEESKEAVLNPEQQ